MKYIKVIVEYKSKDLQESKNKIENILSLFHIFEYEIIEDFNKFTLDYESNFKYKFDVWSIIFYLQDTKFFEKKIKTLKQMLDEYSNLFTYNIITQDINDTDYLDKWKEYFDVTRIYKKIVVSPTWKNYTNKDDLVISIDPGLAFGTGTHETTYLCMKQMYDELETKNIEDKQKLNLLDVGCGSGILMLLAKKLNIQNVTGIDIDPLVKDVVYKNFLNNNYKNPNVIIGNLVDNISEKFDYIVSNILVEVLEDLIKDIKKVCKKNTKLIFSGILTSKKESFIAKCLNLGFIVINQEEKNEWTSIKLMLKEENIIAIDGPSGSGKSTIANLISKKLNLEYINTGSMYRAYALKLIKENIDYNKELLKYINKLDLEIKNNRVYLDKIDVTENLRDEKVGIIASTIVSTNHNIRKYMVELQRKLARNKRAVLDGRDITSVVFPNAKLKIYLDADPKVRAQRRYEELKLKNKEVNFNDVYENVLKRDLSDTTREDSPLVKTEDSIVINATSMSIDEVVEKIINLAKERGI